MLYESLGKPSILLTDVRKQLVNNSAPNKYGTMQTQVWTNHNNCIHKNTRHDLDKNTQTALTAF